MLEYANRNDLTVISKTGAACRNWEGD